MSEIASVSMKQFIKMENSVTNIPVEDYVDALINIEIYERQKKQTSKIKKNSNLFSETEINIVFNDETPNINLTGGTKWSLEAA